MPAQQLLSAKLPALGQGCCKCVVTVVATEPREAAAQLPPLHACDTGNRQQQQQQQQQQGGAGGGCAASSSQSPHSTSTHEAALALAGLGSPSRQPSATQVSGPAPTASALMASPTQGRGTGRGLGF